MIESFSLLFKKNGNTRFQLYSLLVTSEGMYEHERERERGGGFFFSNTFNYSIV